MAAGAVTYRSGPKDIEQGCPILTALSAARVGKQDASFWAGSIEQHRDLGGELRRRLQFHRWYNHRSGTLHFVSCCPESLHLDSDSNKQGDARGQALAIIAILGTGQVTLSPLSVMVPRGGGQIFTAKLMGRAYFIITAAKTA